MEGKPCFCIGHMEIIDHLIIGIADLYLKNNLATLSGSDLETVTLQTWDQVQSALISGRISSAFMPVPIAIDMYAKGFDIKLLMFVHRAGSLIVKSKTPNVKNIADFKNKSVLVPSELSVQAMLMHRLLSSAGLHFGRHDDELSQVTMEVVPPYLMPEMISMDKDGDIAGFSVAQPYGSISIDQGLTTSLCSTSSLWENHPCCAFVANQTIIRNHADSLKEIVSLFIETAKDINALKDERIIDFASSFIGLDKKITRQILLESNISFAPELLTPDIRTLEMIQNYMSDTMNILTGKINISDLIDLDFISDIALESTIEN